MKHQRLYLCLAIALSQLLSAGTLYATTAAKGVFTVAENKTVQFANANSVYSENELIQWGNLSSVTGDGWDLLTGAEWSYLLASGRTNAANLNNLGTVNGKKGLIILSDGWVQPAGVPEYQPVSVEIAYEDNVYTAEQWAVMANAGAVFLPCAGYGYNDPKDDNKYKVEDPTDHGSYWAKDAHDASNANSMRFSSSEIHDFNNAVKTNYYSVILVKTVTPTVLDETDNLATFTTKLAAADDYNFAIVNRTMYKNGTLHTLCLPFDVPNVDASPLAGAEIFEFKGGTVSGAIGSEVLQLNMSRLTGKGLTQGVPYLLRWAKTSPVETLSTLRFYNVKNWDDDTDAATDPGNTTIKFHGVYPKAHIPGYTSSSEKHYNFFLGANDSIYWPDDDNYPEDAGHNMKGFRAYFYIVTAEYPFSAPARQSIQAVWKIDSEVTGYGLPVTGYGLPGTGKLLRDGKVILVIDGKMYDLQGQEIRD